MLFPKAKTKKKRMRHPASILHDKNSRTCYLCVTLHDNWNEHRILDEHHIFGGPNRKNSEEYGLKVYLCHDHHIYGPEAVHNNARIRHAFESMQGRNDRGQELHIYLEGDAKKLFKVIRQEGNNYQKQTGNPVFG